MLSINKKLLILILLVSTSMTTLFTVFSFYKDYHSEIERVDATLNLIERTYLESLNLASYQLNDDQAQALLKGIASLEIIESALIRSDLQHNLEISQPKTFELHSFSRHIVNALFDRNDMLKSQSFPLSYKINDNQILRLGELIVEYNLATIYAGLCQRAIYFFITQGMKTFLVSLILLYLFRNLITRPIHQMASFFRHFENDLNLEAPKLQLGKRIWDRQSDELDFLAFEINSMDQKMRQVIANLEDIVSQRNQELIRKKALLESNLREMQAMQEIMITNEKLASLAQLSTGLAHEIRNPLHFIKSSQEMLNELFDSKSSAGTGQTNDDPMLEDTEQKKLAVDCCEMIAEGVRRIDSIVHTMLSNARSELDEPTKVELEPLMQESYALAYRAAGNESVADLKLLVHDLDSALIYARPGELRRALVSILENAIYALSARRKVDEQFAPSISVRAICSGHYVEISIVDNGIGIPCHLLGQVMNPFFTTKNTNESTGLGLFLTNEIIRSHGGYLDISSREGEHTEIKIYLPQEQRMRIA